MAITCYSADPNQPTQFQKIFFFLFTGLEDSKVSTEVIQKSVNIPHSGFSFIDVNIGKLHCKLMEDRETKLSERFERNNMASMC